MTDPAWDGCLDTPGWTNGDRPGGALRCSDYVASGHCAGGQLLTPWAGGSAFNHPQSHCCACGKWDRNSWWGLLEDHPAAYWPLAAHAESRATLLVCASGTRSPLPRLLRVGDLDIFVQGCAVADGSAATLRLVASANPANGTFATLFGGMHAQRNLSSFGLRVSANNQPCEPPIWQLQALLVDCPRAHCHEAGCEGHVHLKLMQRRQTARETLRLARVPALAAGGGGAWTCTASALFVDRDAPFGALAAWKAAWAAAGFTRSLVFARSEAQCEGLLSRKIADHCEPRQNLVNASEHEWIVPHMGPRAVHYLDHPLNAQLCLRYAQLAGVELLANVDLDERPPLDGAAMADALRALRNGHNIGVLINGNTARNGSGRCALSMASPKTVVVPSRTTMILTHSARGDTDHGAAFSAHFRAQRRFLPAAHQQSLDIGRVDLCLRHDHGIWGRPSRPNGAGWGSDSIWCGNRWCSVGQNTMSQASGNR